MRRPALICLAAAVLSAALLASGHAVVLLAALPAMLLLATLACGRYVGEEALGRLRAMVRRRRCRRRSAGPAVPSVRAGHDRRVASVLLAAGRGVRGPPVAASAA